MENQQTGKNDRVDYKQPGNDKSSDEKKTDTLQTRGREDQNGNTKKDDDRAKQETNKK